MNHAIWHFVQVAAWCGMATLPIAACRSTGHPSDSAPYIGTWTGAITSQNAGSGRMTLTVNADSDGAFNPGSWRMNFSDTTLDDSGRLYVPVLRSEKLSSKGGFIMYSSRTCVGPAGRIEIQLIASVDVSASRMVGTVVESGCTAMFPVSQLDLVKQ